MAVFQNENAPAKNRRHDYKQSVKKPYIFDGRVPFWSHHGNTYVSDEFIRLAPSVHKLHGSIWRTSTNRHKDWEVDFSFKIHGQSLVGGKGMAFWYTKERAIDGPIFGNKDRWDGLGIFMDSTDPANQRLNPIIYGILNDGTEAFPKIPSNDFGGCLRDYKNTVNPVTIRVSYIAKTLRVSVDTISKGAKLITCFEKKGVNLPTGNYFGFSAYSADVGTADDHDLYSFEVFDANPPPKTGEHLRPHEAEMIRKGQEVKVTEEDRKAFEQVQHFVQEEEDKIKEELEGPTTLTPAQMAASVSETQLRIVESLNSVHRKLEVLGAPMQAPETTSQSLVDINNRLDSVAASLRVMESVVQDMVNIILKQGGVSDTSTLTNVLKSELSNLKFKMEDMDSRQSRQHEATQEKLISSSSWLTYIIMLIVLQALVASAYSWYKKQLEKNDKKFI
ncbi:hypothetical protein BGZ76_008141 [Entomortierella beljakovae]|nr:hypothetical protein BGZ76_008141 [Entomortierella beljakovae]